MFPSYEEVKSSISSHIEEVEQKRLEFTSFLTKHVLLALGYALVAFILFVLVEALFLFLLVPFVGYGVYIIIKLTKKYGDIRLLYKENIVGQLSKQILELCSLPNETDKYQYYCTYDHNSRISDRYIYSSKLFPSSIDEITGEDLFAGKIGLTDFKFSEITLVDITTTTDAKGNTSTKRTTIFDGILFIADFHKDFEGITTLTSANFLNRSFLGKAFSFLDSKKRIELESEEFNKSFNVRTTDEIKARYLLSSSMMRRILDFKDKHPQKVELSFVDSYMCISLSSGKNYFEPKYFSPIDDSLLVQVYDDLIFFFGMIEDFDLNTRIWNK